MTLHIKTHFFWFVVDINNFKMTLDLTICLEICIDNDENQHNFMSIDTKSDCKWSDADSDLEIEVVAFRCKKKDFFNK